MREEYEVVIVLGDDWAGAFCDGMLVLEGHSLNPRQLLEVLGIPVRTSIANEDWLESLGRFPDTLEEVVFDA